MEEGNNQIEKVIKEGLEASALDLATDYAELGLDSFLDNQEILEAIPGVKTAVSAFKGILAVKEVFFLKKLFTFFKQFHSGILPQEKRDQFLYKFNTDKNYREAVVEQITVLNDRFLEAEKSKYLANLLIGHVNEKYDWASFKALAASLDSFLMVGLPLLEEAVNKQGFEKYRLKIDINGPLDGILAPAGIVTNWGGFNYINGLGKYLYYFAFKGLWDFPIQSEKYQEN